MDSNGNPVADGNKSIKLTVYTLASGGTQLYTACSADGSATGTPTAVTAAFTDGVTSILIGSSLTCASGSAVTIPADLFNNTAMYLGVTVEADAEMTPRKRIVSAGYALNADRLDDLETSAAGGTSAFVPVTDTSGLFTLTGTPSTIAGVITVNPASPAANALLVNLQNTGSARFTVDAEGDVSAAGTLSVSGTSVTLAGNSTVLDMTGTGTLSLNTVTNRAITTGTGLTTLGGNLTVSGTTVTLANSTAVNTASGALSIGDSGTTSLTLSRSGQLTTVAGDLSVTGNATVAGNLDSSASTFNFAAGATTLNLAGGSGSTGCTVDGSGNFACSGTLSGTYTETDTLAAVTGRGATTTTLVNLDGGIAVDTSNFTVSGTTGAVTTAASLTTPLVTNSGANLALTTTTSGDITFTPAVATGLVNVLAGNFKVGNGTPNAATMDGEDAYIEGELEVDGQAQFDGGLTVGGTGSFVVNVGATVGNADTDTLTLRSEILNSTTGYALQFEGATANNIYTRINVTDPTTTTKTIVLPDASGTFAVSASAPLAIDAAGNVTCATCVVSGGTLFTLAGTSGSNSTISQGGTATIAAGTDITTTGNGSGTLTVANSSTLATVTGRGATTTTLVNLDGGIAVDTSNFTVDGTTGAVSTASTLSVSGNATLAGFLSVDTSTLYVNASTNRVGIGTASPAASLSISGGSLDVGVGVGSGAGAIRSQYLESYGDTGSTWLLTNEAYNGYLFTDPLAGNAIFGVLASSDTATGYLYGGYKGSSQTLKYSVDVDGNLIAAGAGTFTGTLTVNHSSNVASLVAGASATTANIFNTVATTVNVGGAATELNLAGGSASTGCTIDGSGNLACSGTLSGTITEADTLADVTGRGATTTTLVNLDGGIAVDTSNFTVSGTTGSVVTAGDLSVQGNTTVGNAAGDTVTVNAAAWTFAGDTTVALSGGLNGINFDANTLSIDADNDRVGIGTAAPVTQLHVSTDSGVSAARGITLDQHNTGAQAALFSFRKTRNTLASPTTVANGDYTGLFFFQNHDGTAYRANAGFGAKVNGTVSSNNIPTEIFFYTSVADDQDPYANNHVRLLIDSAGNVGIGDITPAALFTVGDGDDFQVGTTGNVSTTGTLTVAGAATLAGNVNLGDAAGDTVTANAAAWTFASDTAVALSGGVNGLNFDSNTLSIDATNNRVGIGTASPTAALSITGGGIDVGLGLAAIDGAMQGKYLNAYGDTGTTWLLSGKAYNGYLLNSPGSGISIFGVLAESDAAAGYLYGGYSGTAETLVYSVGVAGDVVSASAGTFTGTLTVNHSSNVASLVAGASATTANLFNTVATTVNVGGAATELNLAGGSASTGCTIDGSGNLACSGTLSGTYAETDTLADVTGRGATTTTLVNLDGGIAVDTSNFTVSGTTGNVGIGAAAPSSPLRLQVGAATDTSSNVVRIVASGPAADANAVTSYFLSGSLEMATGATNNGYFIAAGPASYSDANLTSATVFLVKNTGAITQTAAVTASNTSYLQSTAISGTAASQVYYGQRLSITNNQTTNPDSVFGLRIDFTDSGSLANAVTALSVDATTANASDTTYAATFSGGNVGIGDVTPAALLTVGDGDDFQVDTTGNVSTSGTLSVAGIATLAGNVNIGDAAGDVVTANAAAWTFASDTSVALSGGVNGLNFDSNTLSIDATNNRLGIGTAAPTSVLDLTTNASGATTVQGSFANTNEAGRAQLIVTSGTYPSNFFALMTHGSTFATNNYLSDATADSGLGILLGQGANMTKFAVGTYSAVPLTFFTSNTERMTVLGSGNVGIGDTTPAALLTVGDGDDLQVDTNGNVSTSGTLAVAGIATLAGNINLGDATGDVITFNGRVGSNIVPTTDNTYDLGTSALRWKTLHLGPGSLVVHNDATDTLKATLGFSGSTASLATDAATPFRLTTGANNGIYVDTAGKVGVGLNSSDVSGVLQVSGDGALVADGALVTPFLSTGEYENLLLRSEAFDISTWAKTNLNTVTANSATDPLGTALAENISGTAADGNIAQTTAADANATYTFSVWLKANSGTPTVSLRIDSAAPETGTEKQITLSSSWQRYSVTQTFASASSFTKTVVVIVGTADIAAWGAQLEPVAYARSYITTTTGAAALARTTLVRTALTVSSTLSASGALTVGTTFTANGSTNTIGNASTDSLTITAEIQGASALAFDGATSDAIVTTLSVTDPTTTSKTIVLPDASGTIAVSASAPLAIDAAGNVTCATCVVSGGTLFTLAGTSGSNSTISQGGTATIAAGTDITTTGNGSGTLTVANSSTLATVTGRGATTTTLVNLDGGIAVDTSNFTVSGTTGAVSTASSLSVGTNATIAGTLNVDSATLYVDAVSNYVGIGGTGMSAKLQVNASGTGGGKGVLVYSNSTSSASPYVEVRGRRSDVNGSQSFSGGLALAALRTDAAPTSGKHLGTVYFGGNHTDGTESNLLYSSSISAIAEGTFSNSTTMPTGLVFYTGSTGTALEVANTIYGTERMRIDASGNVGIGDATPDSLLDVAGTLRVDGIATLAGNMNLGDASGDVLTINSNAAAVPNGLNFDANTLVVDAANNRVGVGVASPAYPLDVYGVLHQTGTDTTNYIRMDSSSQAAIQAFYATTSWSYNTYGQNVGGSGYRYTASDFASQIVQDATSIRFNTAGSGTAGNNISWSEKMTILNGGNVGVGDTSPAALFTVGTSDAFQVAATGNITTSGDLALNGGDLTTSVSDFNIAASSNNINIGGGSTDTGCTVSSGGGLACSGGISSITSRDLYAWESSSEYTRIHYSGSNSYIDFLGGSLFVREGTTERLNIAATTGKMTLAGDLSIGGHVTLAGNSTVIDMTGTGTLSLNTTTNRAITTGTGLFTTGGALSVTGTATLAGNVNLGDTTGDVISFFGRVGTSIVPTTDNTLDLGSASLRWRDLYLGPGSVHVGTSATDEGVISYDTSGNILNFGTDATGNGDIAFFTDDLYLDKSSGFVGIGDITPAASLTVGASDAFQVDSTGRVFANVGASGAGNLAYSFVGDTDSGIYSSASTMIFQTSGTDRLVIDAAGDVGIGVASPGAKLEVLKTGATGSSVALDLSSDNTSTSSTNVKGSNIFALKSVAAAASQTMNVYGEYVTAQNTQANDATSTINTYGGYFVTSGSTDGTATAYGVYASAVSADTNWAFYGANGNAYFNGNVGIKATVPTNDLEIGSTSETGDTTIRVVGQADAGLILAADTDNSTETDNPYISMSQDGGSVTSIMGHSPGTDLDPLNAAYTGVTANYLLIGTTSAYGMQLGTNGSVAVSINTVGDVTMNEDLTLDLNGTATTNGVCHSGTDSDTTATARDLVVCSNTPGDVAEWFETDGAAQPGDIIAPSGDSLTYQSDAVNARTGNLTGEKETYVLTVVTRSVSAYQKGILGVVSTSPAQNYGRAVLNYALNAQPVAVTGRVPVRVTAEGGPIRPGDPITSSSTPGAGMRATRPGSIIGYALDSFDGSGEGRILVTMNPGWHSGFVLNGGEGETVLSDNLAVGPAGMATTAAAYGSLTLTLRGSWWNAAAGAAETVGITMANAVKENGDYGLSFTSTLGEEVAYFGSTGDVAIRGGLTLGREGTTADLSYDAADTYVGDRLLTSASGFGARGTGFAELMPSPDTLEEGELVMVDTGEAGSVRRAVVDEANPAFLIMGVTSKKPAFLAGPADVGRFPITVSGRAKVKVTTAAKGAVRIGDPITVSETAGAGERTEDPAYIIGVALESYDGVEPGLITVYVRPGWYNGKTVAATEASTSGELTTTITSIVDFKAQPLIGIGAMEGIDGLWTMDGEGRLTAKEVRAEKVVAKDLTVEADDEKQAIGEGVIYVGNSSATVNNPMVQPNSRVFITFFANVEGNWWVSQRTNGSFTVSTSKVAPADLQFEYMIVNVEDNRTPPSAAPPVEELAPTEEPPTEETPVPPAEEPPVEEPAPTEEPPAPVEEPAPEPPPTDPSTVAGN